MAVTRAAAVVMAATVLVAGAALSAQASGGSWLLLGGHNDARRTTTLENLGRGAALQLQTRRGYPPLAVTSGRRVPRLNADRLDGMHAESLRTRAYVYRTGGDEDWGPHLTKVFPGLPPGMYLATYQMTVDLYDSGGVSCWFTTPTQSKAGYSTGYNAEPYPGGIATVSASALLDGRGPVSLHCVAGPAYDTVATDTANDSRVTFLRVAPTHTRWATTLDP